MSPSQVEALTFDVFGTVVDWRGSIIREGAEWTQRTGLACDWATLADAWRAGYQPAMQRVRSGEWPWLPLDALHRRILDDLLPRFGLEHLDEAARAHLNRVWHRLDPWPDARAGLERLRGRYIVATLSNGNLSLLTNMAKRADLRWDVILSAELARHYKPDPEVYLTAAGLLGLRPEQVMMVAAHGNDLQAAQVCGLRTAYVHRPHEFGPGRAVPPRPDFEVDIVAADFHDLADQLISR
jgi:2-haloacid dehalogenase